MNSANGTTAGGASRSAFKLFLSFNMTSRPCSSAQDANTLQQYIRTYANHKDYFRYNDRMLVSTFAGEECRFGESSLDDGWKRALRSKSVNGSAVPDVWFVPAFFGPLSILSNSTAIDGLFNVSVRRPSVSRRLLIVLVAVEFGLAQWKISCRVRHGPVVPPRPREQDVYGRCLSVVMGGMSCNPLWSDRAC